MRVKDVVSVALFAALIASLGFVPAIPLPLIPVPITAQTLGVMLAGAILGAKRGFFACIVFLILVAAGLPLLSGGRGGISSFFSPATGYLIGFPFSAWVIGAFYALFRNHLTPLKEWIALIIGGILVEHAIGTIWMAHMLNISYGKALLGDFLFIPGDGLKVALAYFIVSTLRKALPDLFSHHFPRA
ncbi:biotin transporter BioY [Bartonella tamiae]|uniref:Biotin transporter n=1 Tax=Bartonella tamiae Th239 TaxID=1094558 RepID=J0QZI1_9HYPH|nr:biotin transporter BioY [Bartonella tamiae]EJF91556.1 hypothetical protein ME5_00251 [Bartonella tamiae Th239]EJF92460.1 hypothetical protein MEG_01630 [Bartonella tamiae Th307]